LPCPTLFPYTTLFRSSSSQKGNQVDPWKVGPASLGHCWNSTAPDMDLTGLMFFIIEQSVKKALKPSISPNLESKGDHTKVACDRSEEHTSELQSRFDL